MHTRCRSLPHLHVKEGCASVGPADAEDVGRAQLLQGQQKHGPPKNGPAAAPEAACILGALLMLQLGTGSLKRHAPVKGDGVTACLKPIVWIHPQSLHDPHGIAWLGIGSFVLMQLGVLDSQGLRCVMLMALQA